MPYRSTGARIMIVGLLVFLGVSALAQNARTGPSVDTSRGPATPASSPPATSAEPASFITDVPRETRTIRVIPLFKTPEPDQR